MRDRRLTTATLVLGAGLLTAPAAASTAVDLELVLAIDCSYSVDHEEYSQQALGLAAAFRSPEIIQAITQGAEGAIAVTVIQWSHGRSGVTALPWRRIDGPASAFDFAERLAVMQRRTQAGATSISGALRFALARLKASPFSGRRQVIDISADGRNNNGGGLAVVRAKVLSRGVTINGLAIANEVPTLDFYFQRYVIGGTGAFVIKARSYGDYATAIHRKLLNEIQNLPLGWKGGAERSLAFAVLQAP